MIIKAKIEEYLETEDLLYIDIFMVNGVSFNLFQPNEINTLNVEAKEDYVRIYGNVNEYNRIDTCVPYEHITHINAAFGEPQEMPVIEQGESE